jgi:hypothetical protein
MVDGATKTSPGEALLSPGSGRITSASSGLPFGHDAGRGGSRSRLCLLRFANLVAGGGMNVRPSFRRRPRREPRMAVVTRDCAPSESPGSGAQLPTNRARPHSKRDSIGRDIPVVGSARRRCHRRGRVRHTTWSVRSNRGSGPPRRSHPLHSTHLLHMEQRLID